MNKALLAELVDESDLVVHLAAAVGVRLIVESPVRTIDTNIEGTQLVLEAARKKKENGVHCFDLGGLRQERELSLP
jgi:UDP-glucose 4-epimerase